MVRSTANTGPCAWRVWVLENLSRVPPFTRPETREAVLRGVRSLRRVRRSWFEYFGSPRYSKPALYGIDAKLAAHLPDGHGVFVEAGAYDGYRYSNTYYLERLRGWSGVLVEPIPASFRRCVRDRPRSHVFQCALVAADGPQSVVMSYGGPTSAVHCGHANPPAFGWERGYEVSVRARSLTAVLDEAGVTAIDFMSIDVEGFELEVLRGLDLERFAPAYMLVETNGRDDAIAELLGERFELIAHFSAYDAFFRRRS